MKILSQISKGALATTGMVLMGMAVDFFKEGTYELAISSGLFGVILLTVFVVLVEKQATAAALKKFKASKTKRKKK